MNFKEAYSLVHKSLGRIYDEPEARSIARLVFEHLEIPHVKIFTHPNEKIPETKLAKMAEIQKLLNEKIPVQYVLGYAWFHDRKFKVSPACLIPRQETEEMVDHIVRSGNSYRRILDIGTGSGCIAISLKLAFEDSQVTAMDISEAALTVAKINAEQFDANVTFIRDDIHRPNYGKYPGWFDLIVSNPPYVKESEIKSMDEIVYKNEPREALFVKDADPLIFYHAISDFAEEKLSPEGMLFLELNEAHASECLQLFGQKTKYKALILKDIHGKDRFLKVMKNE